MCRAPCQRLPGQPRSGGPRLLATCGALAVAVCAAAPSRAADAFEIQVYDGTANHRGEVGLETHLNFVASGLRAASPPEAPAHQQLHLTFEPSVGVTDFLELGAYLQFARLADGAFRYAGAKLRCKLVTPPGWHRSLRLGFNVELSVLPDTFDASRFGGELRPIIAWEDDRLLLALNPNIGVSLARPGSAEGPGIEPGAMAKVKLFGGKVAAGLEYYADLGTFAGLVPFASQGHTLYEAVDLLGLGPVDLNLGIGQGLTSASNGFTVKVIVGLALGGKGR